MLDKTLRKSVGSESTRFLQDLSLLTYPGMITGRVQNFGFHQVRHQELIWIAICTIHFGQQPELKTCKCLPDAKGRGALPAMISRNAPVPIVSFTLPTSLQNDPNKAADWSAICKMYWNKSWWTVSSSLTRSLMFWPLRQALQPKNIKRGWNKPTHQI